MFSLMLKNILEVINLIALIFSALASAYLFFLVGKSKLLKKGLLLLALGVFIGLVLHSAVELLEAVGYLKTAFLLKAMPLLVITGALLILLGGLIILYNVTNPIKKLMLSMRRLQQNGSGSVMDSELKNIDNEIGKLYSQLVETTSELRESEEKYRHLFDNLTDAAFLVDAETWRILKANKQAEVLLGRSLKEIIGMHQSQLHPPQKAEEYRQKFSLHIQQGKAVDYDGEVIRKDGEVIPVAISASATVIAKKHLIIGLFRDITERKKIEGSSRLAELGKLVSSMAHEVNNPLMIISGNAQLSLMEEIESEEVKNNLKIIIDESQRAKDIIQRLLRFSRPSKGETKEVDINKSIEAVVGIVEHQFKLANVEIKRNYLETSPLISIDEQQMQEVFMNLINNAAEAMPDGGVITITTSLEGDFLRIDFQDTGSGMSEEVAKKVFEPFFTTKEKGTGLGLSVCYGLIKAHNGELKFESELNKGTTVTVLLPIRGVKRNA